MKFSHKFVTRIPENLEDGVVYISVEYATAIHKCACGCGREVVTPFSPTDWWLVFDGKTVSLRPSIGNWNFECQSHYWITNDTVEWAPKLTWREVERAAKKNRARKKAYYKKQSEPSGKSMRKAKNIGEEI